MSHDCQHSLRWNAVTKFSLVMFLTGNINFVMPLIFYWTASSSSSSETQLFVFNISQICLLQFVYSVTITFLAKKLKVFLKIFENSNFINPEKYELSTFDFFSLTKSFKYATLLTKKLHTPIFIFIIWQKKQMKSQHEIRKTDVLVAGLANFSILFKSVCGHIGISLQELESTVYQSKDEVKLYDSILDIYQNYREQ